MTKSIRNGSRRELLVAALAVCAGCSATAPSTRVESSAASIRAAQEAGAAKEPSAALHLQLAEEQAEHAKGLIAEGGDVERADAELLLMRAQADAELALAIAREGKDRIATQQAVDQAYSTQTSQ
jgi:hypothetical protein